MKTSIIIIYLLAHGLGFLGAEDDPFAEAPPEPPRPERKIALIPKSITHKKSKDGGHSYTITGIYSNQKKGLSDDGSTYGVMVPDCVGCKLDYDKGVCTILTSRQLTKSELAYAIDDMARMGGEVPYWLELVARDIPKGEFYDKGHFVVKPRGDDTPKGLAWFWLGKHSAFSIPLGAGIGAPATLRIVPTTAICMAHSRFSLRILDSEGKLVWHESVTAYAAVRIAISDINEDGIHEILLDRDDHGKKTKYVIQKK